MNSITQQREECSQGAQCGPSNVLGEKGGVLAATGAVVAAAGNDGVDGVEGFVGTVAQGVASSEAKQLPAPPHSASVPAAPKNERQHMSSG